MTDTVTERARAALAELLAAHGYVPTRYRDWLLILPTLPAVDVTLHHDEAWHPSVFHAEFHVLVGAGRVIVESFGVVADDESALVVHAVQKFAAASLHVVLAALCGDADAAGAVETLEWTAPDASRWRAFVGGWQLTLCDGAGREPPSGAFEALEPLIKARLVDGSTHWFRVYLSSMGGRRSVEVLWDNEPWPAAEEALRDLDGGSDHAPSARCFAIVRPKDLP